MGVRRGDKLMSVLNVSNLWLWANFYENEVGLLREGQALTVALPVLPNHSFEGKIAVLSPTIDPVKRTAMARIDIPNSNGQLRPGMYANVVAEIDAGEGLTIPCDAVLPTGSRMLAFVDGGSGRLEPRFIQVGLVLVPVLMTWLIRGRITPEKKNPLNALLIGLYDPLVTLVLRLPWVTLGIAAALLALTWIPFSRLGKEFMPPLNEGTILYMPAAVPGISTLETSKVGPKTLIPRTERNPVVCISVLV